MVGKEGFQPSQTLFALSLSILREDFVSNRGLDLPARGRALPLLLPIAAESVERPEPLPLQTPLRAATMFCRNFRAKNWANGQFPLPEPFELQA